MEVLREPTHPSRLNPPIRKIFLEISFTEVFSAALAAGEGSIPVRHEQVLSNEQLVDILFELVPKMLHTRVLYDQPAPPISSSADRQGQTAFGAAPTTADRLSSEGVSARLDRGPTVAAPAEALGMSVTAPVRRLQQQKRQLDPVIVTNTNSSEWTDRQFSWSADVQLLHQEIFGHQDFRPLQREILDAILSGRDVFACLPTGSGKSLFYQLPPLIKDCSPGVSIVVMPLVALIADQRRQFEIYGISCMTLGTSEASLQKIEKNLTTGRKSETSHIHIA